MFLCNTVPVKTLAILSQKGGSGKTTLAVHLAVAADRGRRSTVIIDLDPQASAAAWKDLRSAETPAVVSAQAARLEQVLAAAESNGVNLAILDTAPHSESASLAAARAADLVLLPCRPAILDLRAIHITVDLVRLASRPAAIVLNAVPPRGGLADDASAAVAQYELPVAPVRIAQRAAYMHSLTLGQTAQEYEPDGKAADEISRLYRWTCKHVGLLRD
jgi:chromosome partitioning protein